MGKRELVLIVAFIFLGTLLYQATAPPSPEGRGFSLRGMIDQIRREVGPRHEYLADERRETIPIATGVTEVRIGTPDDPIGEVRVEGSDADEAVIGLQVYSTGLDEKEAGDLGKKTLMRTTVSGELLSVWLTYPPPGRQRAIMNITLPRRLRVRVTRVARLEVRNIGGVEFDDTRGTATIIGIDGPVRGTHNGGEVTLEKIKAVDLTLRRSEVTITGVEGDVRLDVTGGQVTARQIVGNVDLDGNRVSIELERIGGTLKADLTQGSLEVTGLAKPARVDARGTELRFDVDQPAAITAITTGESITVRLPQHAGFTLDATVEDGDIRVPDGAPAPSRTEQTSRAQGAVRGGGPTLALRTTHADIVVR
jgi:hypothetical protein